VSVKVALNRAETNELFLSGDSILSWPVEGLLPSSEEASMPGRSSIFVSEVAAQPEGLLISYSDQTDAQHTLALLREQFAKAGINEKV
jgi:hypothetical protein